HHMIDCFFSYRRDYRGLHSFPTRRSSDLRQQPVILLLPIEISRLADPGLAADLGDRHAVIALLQNERLLGVRKLRGFHRLPLLRSEEHTSELQSRENLVCRLLLEKKKIQL